MKTQSVGNERLYNEDAPFQRESQNFQSFQRSHPGGISLLSLNFLALEPGQLWGWSSSGDSPATPRHQHHRCLAASFSNS